MNTSTTEIKSEQAWPPGLYVVGTPIGNLADLTYRGEEALRQADVVLAEDTRRTRRLLARYNIEARLVSCHRFNEQARVEKTLELLRSGQVVALVSDAGMPGISDPGARVVDACRREGFHLSVIPGPSSVCTAMAMSGMGGGAYRFEGFLAHKSGARKRRLEALRDALEPVVLFESPYRLLKLMGEIEEVMGPRELFVGRELTKAHEEGTWGTPEAVRARYEGRRVRGELVVIIAPESDR
jgi:16S rRNA (cytidine1402-2'-O)-methyltransferase